MEEVPRARVRIPKALVSFSRPIRSQIMMEVKDIKAAEKLYNNGFIK